MKFTRILPLLSVCALAALCLTARAETVDDIAALGQKNVGEDVLLTTVNNSKSDFTLSAQDIIKLKNANVSNTVITAMLKHKGSGVAAAPAPAPVPAEAPAPAPAPAAAAAAPIPGDGTLDVENLDNRVWTYRFEPASKTLWFVPPVPQDNRGNIGPSGNVNLRMASGTYQIRYVGQTEGPAVTVNGGQKSQILLSRVNTDQLEALYVGVFENGEKRPGGRLVVLRANGPVKGNSEAAPAPDAAPGAPPQAYTDATPIQPQTYVEQPSTTYVYRDPAVYVAPPPVVYYPYRYGYGPYYPHGVVNFGYFGGGRHSRYGGGIGFGF